MKEVLYDRGSVTMNPKTPEPEVRRQSTAGDKGAPSWPAAPGWVGEMQPHLLQPGVCRKALRLLLEGRGKVGCWGCGDGCSGPGLRRCLPAPNQRLSCVDRRCEFAAASGKLERLFRDCSACLGGGKAEPCKQKQTLEYGPSEYLGSSGSAEAVSCRACHPQGHWGLCPGGGTGTGCAGPSVMMPGQWSPGLAGRGCPSLAAGGVSSEQTGEDSKAITLPVSAFCMPSNGYEGKWKPCWCWAEVAKPPGFS